MAQILESCPKCGKTIPQAGLGGLCPNCMMEGGLATDTQHPGEFKPVQAFVSPLPASEIARHFPQLEIAECLGRGGMGVVYKARQPRLNRWVALKILAPEKEGDPKFGERFEREAQALAAMNHPHIVTVYDFGQTNGLYYLLMEYVDGASVRDLLKDGRLTPQQALNIVPPICEALQYAHKRGVIHRDIKPENVLLSKDGQVKIADFGIAKILGHTGEKPKFATDDSLIVGTPNYMAPEQVEHPQAVDHRADIYSLGVVFYEMLTGELPIGKFALPSRKVQVDVRLDEVVLHALEKDPNRRYQHASEIKTDVEKIASAEGNIPERDADRGLRMGARAARWIARAFSLALLLFYGFFIAAEGLPALGTQPGGVQLNFAALALMLLGFVAGMQRDGAAAFLIAAGWTVWQVSESAVRLNWLQTPLPIALLFAFSWWVRNGRNTRRVLTSVGAFAVVFLIGRLFLPTNVFISGGIRDALSGKRIGNAVLQVDGGQSPGQRSPSARANTEGSFTLYLGWYDPGAKLQVSAPGYTTLQTNLGPRAWGARKIQKSFSLVPSSPRSAETALEARVPPVIVNTSPAAGASAVDFRTPELRVTFSQPMSPNGWSWGMVQANQFPQITGNPKLLPDQRTFVLPVKLEPGRTYAVWLNTTTLTNFQNLSGQPALPYLLVFKTRN